MNQIDNRQRSGGRASSSRNGSSKNVSETGRRTGQTYRTGSSYQPKRGKKRKRGPQYNITKILLAIILAVAAFICVMAAVKLIGGRKAKETEVNTPTVSETELRKEVKVDGISIAGMSREEARDAIEKKYQWGMKVTYHDDQYELKNLLDKKLDSLLEEIYSGEPKESYTLEFDGLDEDVQAEVKAIAGKWDVAAKNGSISGFDKSAGKFVYSGEKNGVVINQDKLASDILTQLKDKNFQAVIAAEGKEVAPKITEAQAKEMYKVIGTYTTTTTANSARNKNIELASEALNGVILQPGEEFSFNKATGERSTAKGYRPAGAYLNGELVEEPGGGVCQVSSTLYNAVVFAGISTTERHAHSYEPSYVTPGEDAMVSYGGPDMKFVNNSTTAIAIRTSFADRKLKISIVGIPILEEGVTLSMTSKKTAELDAPAPVYEEDQTLQPTEEKIVKAETKGSRWVTNLVTKKNGVVVSDEFFHNSTYRGKSATIKRNKSGVVIPATDPATSAPETTGVSPQGPGETTAPHDNETAGNSGGPQGPGTTETQPTQPQGPSSTTEAAGDNGGQNVIPPNPFN
ncbi:MULTISPECIES: VanW family protein [Clostridia]|uniref:Vanomycin resistance protein VanB n=1 Tax=Lacrimispora celerecrescens TaxID=29354 RepID=A0A084JK40_9FIRM|nr:MULTISPECIES: VanW family protein [Clostridia]KEZ89324.1 vanomycin resistance protein VanB [Lacrimispora celerecrescens]MBW4845372.1 VanW family protein [Lachnospiraceae bacterium]MSS09746.1 vanomycin resistance protein VanB [Clostridium sp. WB02_MRS01]